MTNWENFAQVAELLITTGGGGGGGVRIVSLFFKISPERSEEMFDANSFPYNFEKVHFPERWVRDQVLTNVGLAMNIASLEVARVVKTQEGEVG